MHAFEQYLIEQGFEMKIYDCKTGELKSPKRHFLSTMVNLDHRYIKGDEMYIFGLSEKDMPPTLIWPRPNIKVIREVDGEISYENEQRNRNMDVCLMRETPEDIINAIRTGHTFHYDLTKKSTKGKYTKWDMI